MPLITLVSLIVALSGGQQSATSGAPEPVAERQTAGDQTPGGSNPASTLGAAPARPGDRLICSNTQVTGTRFPIRRCRTAEQISLERIEAQEELRRQQGARVPQP